MAVPASTLQTFTGIGIRESLENIIHNMMPTETPLYTMAKKSNVGSRTPEWMRSIDADPSPTNLTIEGDDVSNDATVQPERVKNVTQLFDKVAQVSSTMQAVNVAGRKDEMSYQMAMRARELKRDMEARFQGNFSSVVGNASTAGSCAGVEAFITTNFDRGATGANGGFNSGTGLITQATDGTLRTITETLFKNVVANVWINGGEDAMVLVGPSMKQKISSTFTGIATQYNAIDGQKKVLIQGGIDLYRSDFGIHKIVPTRLGSYGTGRTRNYRPAVGAETTTANRSILVLDPGSWTIAFLQPINKKDLAENGHSKRRMLWCEATLECSDERVNGVIADVQTA